MYSHNAKRKSNENVTVTSLSNKKLLYCLFNRPTQQRHTLTPLCARNKRRRTRFERTKIGHIKIYYKSTNHGKYVIKWWDSICNKRMKEQQQQTDIHTPHILLLSFVIRHICFLLLLFAIFVSQHINWLYDCVSQFGQFFRCFLCSCFYFDW